VFFEKYSSGISNGCPSYLEQTKCRRVSPVTATRGTWSTSRENSLAQANNDQSRRGHQCGVWTTTVNACQAWGWWMNELRNLITNIYYFPRYTIGRYIRTSRSSYRWPETNLLTRIARSSSLS